VWFVARSRLFRHTSGHTRNTSSDNVAAMSSRGESGQASVELVALLPLLVVLGAGLWQVALAGQAIWAGAAAARAGARAEAVAGDAEAAARRVVPARLREGLRVRVDDEGAVEVRVPVRALAGEAVLWTATHTATFVPQR
jgi:hypothetical protein